MGHLGEEQVMLRLRQLPGWSTNGAEIRKQFAFPSFADAMRFVNAVARAAEGQDHHPDILIAFNRVTFSLTTHAEGGLTEKDFALAKEIERLA